MGAGRGGWRSLLNRAWFGFAVVAAVAIAVQSYQLVQLADDPGVRGPIIDGRGYHHEASAMAAGKSAPKEPHFQSPIFPWTLALFYRVAGATPFTGLYLQALVAVLIALSVLALGRLFLSGAWSIAAGLLACFYGPLLFFCGQLIPDPLATAAALGTLYLAATSRQRASPGQSALLGLAMGVAVAARGTVAPFILWLLYRPFRTLPFRQASASALLLAFGTWLAMTPVACSNWRRSGDFSLATSNQGVNLYIGNNPEMIADTSARPGYRWDRIMSLPARHGVTGRSEQSGYYNKQVVDWALSHPLALIKGLVLKSADLLNGREIPRNLDIRGEQGNTALSLTLIGERPLRFPFGIVLPLAVLGFASGFTRTSGRGRRALETVFWFACLNGAGIVAFFPTSRYRLALALALLPVALAGAGEIKRWLDRKSKPALVPAALALAAALWANLAPTSTGPRLQGEQLLQLGWAHMSAGEYRRAVEVLDQEVRNRPDEADGWRSRAEARDRLGDGRGAMEDLQRAVELQPEFAHALQHLGALHNSFGEFRQAVDALERCVASDPGHPLGWGQLARAYLGLSDWQSAIYSGQKAVEVNPGHGHYWLYLGIALRHTGDFAGAETALRRAVALRPNRANPPTQLARCLAEMGREREAIELMRQTVRRWPRSKPARNYLKELEPSPDALR